MNTKQNRGMLNEDLNYVKKILKTWEHKNKVQSP